MSNPIPQSEAIRGDEEQQATKGHHNNDYDDSGDDLEPYYEEEEEEEERTDDINHNNNNNHSPEMQLATNIAHSSQTHGTPSEQTDDGAIDTDKGTQPTSQARAPKKKQRVETFEASGYVGAVLNDNHNDNINANGDEYPQNSEDDDLSPYESDGDKGDTIPNYDGKARGGTSPPPSLSEEQEDEEFSNGGWTPNVGAGFWEWRVEPLSPLRDGSNSRRWRQRTPRQNGRFVARIAAEFRETYASLCSEMTAFGSEDQNNAQVQVEAHEKMKSSRVVVQVREDLPLLILFVHRQYAVIESTKRIASVAVQHTQEPPPSTHTKARNDIRDYCAKLDWVCDVKNVVQHWVGCVTAASNAENNSNTNDGDDDDNNNEDANDSDYDSSENSS